MPHRDPGALVMRVTCQSIAKRKLAATRLAGTDVIGPYRKAEFTNPWKGLGSGVYELVEPHRGDTFRAVYVVRVADAVHVLHAFQKKSKSGIATPQPDVELIEKRLKVVLARYGIGRR